MELDLYVNGLFWKKHSVYGDSEYIAFVPIDLATFPPMQFDYQDDFLECPTMNYETKRFIAYCFFDGTNHQRVFNLDDPEVYIDIPTNQLRSRKSEEHDEAITEMKERKKYIERPVKDRFEILDL